MSTGGKRRTLPNGRSGSRMKPHSKKPLGEQFIAHTREMRQSVAWRLLTGNDKLALERIEEEHMAHAGRENGSLHVTYGDFVQAGLRRAAVSTSIARLEALGFIECMDRGRVARAEYRFPASYRLTYAQGNLKPTDEWRAIVDVEGAERRIANTLANLTERTDALRQRLAKAKAAQVGKATNKRAA